VAVSLGCLHGARGLQRILHGKHLVTFWYKAARRWNTWPQQRQMAGSYLSGLPFTHILRARGRRRTGPSSAARKETGRRSCGPAKGNYAGSPAPQAAIVGLGPKTPLTACTDGSSLGAHSWSPSCQMPSVRKSNAWSPHVSQPNRCLRANTSR